MGKNHLKLKIMLMISVLGTLIFGCLSASSNVFATTEELYDDEMAIDETVFPDDAFRMYVQDNIDQNGNGALDEMEIGACIEIDCSGMDIFNLTGIEIFYNLEKLTCNKNNLSSLDISKNTKITQLDCSNNKLKDLDISKNTALVSLYCYANNISNVNTSENIGLKKFVLLNVPVVNIPTSRVEGVNVSWSKSAGADGYYIYRRVKDGSWKRIATVTGENTLLYMDQTAISGTIYEYTIKGYYSDETGTVVSGYDQKGKRIHFIAAPIISELQCTNNGIKITWGKVPGAVKYRVYYKTASGTWKKITDTTSASYTWTKAKTGTSYTFTVRCIDRDGKNHTSSYDSTGKSIQYVATPTISSVTNVNGGIKITWNKPAGSVRYRLYYKTGSGSWAKIAETTSSSYIWKGAKGGTTYTFTVRCVSRDSKSFTSGYDSKGKKIQYIATPKLSAVSNVKDGVKISWGKVAGAAKYRVYYKTGSGKWKRIGETTSTSYTWTGAKSGTTYTFTVRCISSDSKSFTSSYDNTGKSLKYIAAPKLSDVSNVNGGIKISWGKVTGAAKYRVYYKIDSGKWKKVGETAATSYIWTGAKKGTAYRFTVRCISSDGKTTTSGYDPVGMIVNDILTLVNPTHTIPSNWTWDLVSLGGGHYIDRRAYADIQSMLNDCRSAGFRPLICSSYRTHEKQISLYNNKVNSLINQGYSREQAKVEAAKWVAIPGTSEHELGLAVDIVDISYQVLDAKQANTATQIWLMNNSYKYGFILRYQKDKMNITGINYEPWHYRYVGKEAATYMYQNGICLEEYLESR